VRVTWFPGLHALGLNVMAESGMVELTDAAPFRAAVLAAVGSPPIAITRTPSRAALVRVIWAL